jgi:glycosyltransferase involved in cell wall biosynthesis
VRESGHTFALVGPDPKLSAALPCCRRYRHACSAILSRPARGPPPVSATIGLLSTYPPTQCGLATFTAALAAELPAAGVVRVLEHRDERTGPEVVAQLVASDAGSVAPAIERLNAFDVVVLQHEYGIFGGLDGREVLDVVELLTVPLVVVFHTVLVEPTLRQRRILDRLLATADVGITMTETARQRLIEHYDADPDRLMVIPHGAVRHAGAALPDLPTGRPLILTWGLLGPGKGIEWVLEALPALRDLDPRYLVLGKTHPKVLEHSGEMYRRHLERIATHLSVKDLVEMDDSYVTVAELARIVEQADVVLLPYDSQDQVTSGVLIEAVAAGRPVVSTAFPHAVELLSDGTGLLVDRRDPRAIAAAVRRVLTEPALAADMAQRATAKAPALSWPSVAGRYQAIADQLAAANLAAAS